MQSETSIRDLIADLELERHPEGGWYRETYRAAEVLPAQGLPTRFGGDRVFSTAIYFLLGKGEFSALHRIKSDELWHFYSGTTLTIHVISPSGKYQQIKLGSGLDDGETFQAPVPAGFWFGAEVTGIGEYSLVGCTVAPGFDFDDFEMGKPDKLLADFPAHERIIKKLTRAL